MVLLKLIVNLFNILKSITFTFQYGSTQIPTMQIKSGCVSLFTFQYGSTQIGSIAQQKKWGVKFTFQYGSTQIYIP